MIRCVNALLVGPLISTKKIRLHYSGLSLCVNALLVRPLISTYSPSDDAKNLLWSVAMPFSSGLSFLLYPSKNPLFMRVSNIVSVTFSEYDLQLPANILIRTVFHLNDAVDRTCFISALSQLDVRFYVRVCQCSMRRAAYYTVTDVRLGNVRCPVSMPFSSGLSFLHSKRHKWYRCVATVCQCPSRRASHFYPTPPKTLYLCGFPASFLQVFFRIF